MFASNCDEKQNTIIVFHSYPSKPCIDGLLSTIITTKLHQATNIALVPYWRTEESFKRLKTTVEELEGRDTKIIYVDCSPDLPNEVDYLSTLLNDGVPVYVYDHHPKKDGSPINKLIGREKFEFTFDPNNCAAKMMYTMLTKEQKEILAVEPLMNIVQYSEYEGMNPKVAGMEKAESIAKEVFENIEIKLKNLATDSIKNLHQIEALNMSLFYILDLILTDNKQWSFFYKEKLSYQKVTARFQEESAEYLRKAERILRGDDLERFSNETTTAYLKLLEKLQKNLSLSLVLESKTIGEKICNIIAGHLSIFEFGRSLEPQLRNQMEKTNSKYAIVMNPPTTDAVGTPSYYFSLRRINDEYDARDLAKFIMNSTGSTIGGGHPWASGVTLNQVQYDKFIQMFQKYDEL